MKLKFAAIIALVLALSACASPLCGLPPNFPGLFDCR